MPSQINFLPQLLETTMNEVKSSSQLGDLATGFDTFTAPDPFLQRIADMANRADAGFSITLYLPWGVARGTVVAARSFFTWIAEQFGSHPDDDEMKPMATAFSTMMSTFADVVTHAVDKNDEIDEDDDINPFSPRFITLKDVQTLGLGNQGPFPGIGTVPFLRVQLSHVTAWSLTAPQFD